MPSTVISTYTYKPEKAELVIVFLSGLVYAYSNVPPEVFQEFRAARSKGSFLNRRIKGVYKFVRLPRP